MYVVVRRWTGAKPLIDAMLSKQQNVREVISGVPGFIAYYALRQGDELTSVTVCQDQAGTEESTNRARAWARENVPGVTLSAPTTTSGEPFISFQK